MIRSAWRLCPERPRLKPTFCAKIPQKIERRLHRIEISLGAFLFVFLLLFLGQVGDFQLEGKPQVKLAFFVLEYLVPNRTHFGTDADTQEFDPFFRI